MLEKFFQTFVLYFVVIDPLAAAPLFLIVTQGLKVKNKLRTAFEATLIATLILIFFAILIAKLDLPEAVGPEIKIILDWMSIISLT